jgi:PncC family amidohydrolase
MTPKRSLEFRVYSIFTRRKKTLAVAESCTGGLVSHLLTSVPGSSKYFLGAIVAYSNNVKVSQLAVPKNLIMKHGAVSSEVARKIAENVRRKLGSDVGAGVTGIAGPTGGTAAKPVGLAYIAVATKARTVVKRVMFKGNRGTLKRKFAEAVLRLVVNSMR